MIKVSFVAYFLLNLAVTPVLKSVVDIFSRKIILGRRDQSTKSMYAVRI